MSGFHLQKLAKSYKTINKCDISKNTHFRTAYPFIISIRMSYLPHRIHGYSIWTWSVFHLKNLYSPKITKKNPIKSIKIKFFKKSKKPSWWTISMNKSTKFSADLNIFKYRNSSTFVFVIESQIHGLAYIFLIGHFVAQKVWKAYKNFTRHSEEKSYRIYIS